MTLALLAGRGQQLRGADDVEHAGRSRRGGVDRDAGENALVGAGDDDVAAGGDAPGRNEVGQQALQPLDGGGAILPDRGEAVEALGQDIGERQRGRASMAARFWRFWSITCTKAPRQMVIRKAMIRVGTARRSAGSAVSSR